MRTLLIAVTLASICSTESRAADPTPDKGNKLPADAEVHAVAVSQPLHSGVSEEEITDWLGLVKALRAKAGPGHHIRKLLPAAWADEVLTAEVEMGRLGDLRPFGVKTRVTHRLCTSLSIAMEESVFYDKDVFAKVELTKSLKELVALGDKRTVFQTQRMNRELLSLVFPKCIADTPADFHTVRITVKAGKPVVLVTSAYTQTRWVVTAEKGATVAAVIQIGNFAQELTGTDAQLFYMAGSLPDGTRSVGAAFNAWKQEGVSYDRMKALVKEITGKGFTSFQGQYQSGKEPFVVKPSAK